jgi:NarL family two-component system response regulator LiaR
VPRLGLYSPCVKKTVIVYGLLAGVLIAALQFIQYRFLVLEHSLETYGGLVALVFSGLGIWLGLKLTRVREVPVIREVQVEVPVLVQVGGPVQRNEARVAQLGITPRELEILEAIAAGAKHP